jgi:L-fuculose-phosphate aldolase
MKQADLSGYQVLTGKDLEKIYLAGSKEVLVAEKVILTPTARDVVRRCGIQLTPVAGTLKGLDKTSTGSSPVACSLRHSTSLTSPAGAETLFNSPEALAVKEEIVRIGKKLWDRQYVDGNGGNISFRLRDQLVLCTPTLCSKADLTVEDICLVDLEGKQMAGKRPRTSEILMHLEIYKAVPQARAVVHAHPPHATAYAITGLVPPLCIIPESEVFIGSVALSPYETPGTKTFAETVIPYARQHNTILLANHGVVCWADSVTHAEWYMEVVDNYCRTLMLANQLGAPITRIPPDKASALLDIKKKMGIPDPRFEMKECQFCDQPDFPIGTRPQPIACPTQCSEGRKGNCGGPSQDLEPLIQSITNEILVALKIKGA